MPKIIKQKKTGARKLQRRKSEDAKKPTITKQQAEQFILEFNQLKENKKAIEIRENELKEVISDYLENNVKPDNKGHLLFSMQDKDGKPLHFMRQARKKVMLNQDEAIAILRNLDLDNAIERKKVIAKEVTQDQLIILAEKHAKNFIDEVEEVPESTIKQLLDDGLISIEDFERMCEIKTSYAMTFIPDEKLEK